MIKGKHSVYHDRDVKKSQNHFAKVFISVSVSALIYKNMLWILNC